MEAPFSGIETGFRIFKKIYAQTEGMMPIKTWKVKDNFGGFMTIR
jgi:hypothetical protein